MCTTDLVIFLGFLGVSAAVVVAATRLRWFFVQREVAELVQDDWDFDCF